MDLLYDVDIAGEHIGLTAQQAFDLKERGIIKNTAVVIQFEPCDGHYEELRQALEDL